MAKKVPRLFEISATVRVTSVILAMSQKDALSHVILWEQAWLSPKNADLCEVSDIECTHSRDRESIDWTDDAHDITARVVELVPKTKGEAR